MPGMTRDPRRSAGSPRSRSQSRVAAAAMPAKLGRKRRLTRSGMAEIIGVGTACSGGCM
jgi:hypothetical protein